MDISSIALAAGLAWASGIRLYVAVFMVGIAGYYGWIELPAHLEVLANPLVLATSGTLAVAEFFADKIPGFDSLWDAVHTFIRIPAGALLAAGSVGVLGEDSLPLMFAAGMIGGTITAGSHFSKAGSRIAINHSPEPFSNWLASLFEDIAAPGIVWLAIVAPVILLFALLGAIVVAIWLLPRLWRWIATMFRRIASWGTSGSSVS
ncbi:MAG: DUF4126 domain-containing protein [Gammaproteobacteria bacterium]|nr:DUF4126 domain-containing protein [Gammaproteobacteria bacterium]MDH5276692.1 DUF4126 domain-containing protein [Gammaproteobacteria bacterium]